MSTPVTVSLDGHVAVIRIDNPPVNALSPQVVEALPAALAQAAADPAVAGIVLAGAGRTFVAGADIKGLEDVVWGAESGAPDMHGFLASIENCPKPVVMAMHGTALGGGLEVAMAGHYRVAVPDAQLGQPEVNLGIIPGAEGTQRLPRLVGVETALTMCVSGRPVKAAEALQSGLIDRVVDDLIPGAVAFANEVVARGGPHPKTSERTDRLPARDALPAWWPPRTSSPARCAAARRRRRAPSRPSKPRPRCRSTKAAAASASCSSSARVRNRPRRSSMASSPSARWRRCPGSAGTSSHHPSRRSPSSAPARWAAASPWPVPTPA